jgi:hypothetical protein
MNRTSSATQVLYEEPGQNDCGSRQKIVYSARCNDSTNQSSRLPRPASGNFLGSSAYKEDYRVSDPLGGSLHSALHHQPRRIVEVEGGASPRVAETRKRALRHRPPGQRGIGATRSRDLLVSETSCQENAPPKEEKKPSSPKQRHRKYPDQFTAYRSTNHHSGMGMHMMTTTTCPPQTVEDCMPISTKGRAWLWWLQILLFCLVGGFIYTYVNSRLDAAHQALHKSHQENSKILSEMEWLDKRAKYNHNYNNNNKHDLSSRIVKEDSDQRQIEALSGEVQVLRSAIQQSAREQLSDTFTTSPHSMEAQLVLEGLEAPLVLQVSHKEMPYTTWTWLDQVRRGEWDRSLLNHADADFMEITPALSVAGTRDRVPHTKLNFLEDSVLGGQRFVLGLRNSPRGVNKGLILTIHLTERTCGQVEDEVCFGKVLDGFDSLNKLDSMRQPITVRSVKVRETKLL